MFAGLRRMARREWRSAFQALLSSSQVRTKRSLGYFWVHVYLNAKSGPHCGSVINPVNYIAVPEDLLERIFVVVRNTRRTEYDSQFAARDWP